MVVASPRIPLAPAIAELAAGCSATEGCTARPAPLVVRRLVVGLAVAVFLVACSGSAHTSSGSTSATAPGATAASPGAPSSVELTVFAAASLKTAFTKLGAAFEAAHPGVTVVFSFDASSTLRTQIEQGAPADVFASADEQNPAALVGGGLAIGPPTPFAANALAIIVPVGNPAQIATPADLARPGVKVVAAGAAVPITKYADQLVANLAAQPGYPAAFVTGVTANVVSQEDNVKGIVTKIELGEGDAGIVYATDAKASAKVQTIPLSAAANVRATYDAVVVRASAHPAQAADFLAFLHGPDGQAILAEFGFLPAP
jgi:molybdate transport system substrate-binding protein